MDGAVAVNAILLQRATVLQMLAVEHQPLLVRRRPLHVLELALQVRHSVPTGDPHGVASAGEGLDVDLHLLLLPLPHRARHIAVLKQAVDVQPGAGASGRGLSPLGLGVLAVSEHRGAHQGGEPRSYQLTAGAMATTATAVATAGVYVVPQGGSGVRAGW